MHVDETVTAGRGAISPENGFRAISNDDESASVANCSKATGALPRPATTSLVQGARKMAANVRTGEWCATYANRRCVALVVPFKRDFVARGRFRPGKPRRVVARVSPRVRSSRFREKRAEPLITLLVSRTTAAARLGSACAILLIFLVRLSADEISGCARATRVTLIGASR